MDCLKSVLTINYPNYKVVVIDNASTEGSYKEIKHDFPFVKLIRNKENLGYAGGNNIGIKYAIENDADYVLLLNDDTVVEPDFLKELVNIAEKDPKIGVVGPKVCYFEEPARLYQFYGKNNPFLNIHYKSLEHMNKPEEVHYLYGVALLIKKGVIKRVGLLDENFFMYVEEEDWCYRIRKAGYKIVYVPSSKLYHKVSRSFSRTTNPAVLYYNTRNELLFARKNLNFLLFLLFWFPRFILRIVRYALKTRKISLVQAILNGFIDFTRNKYGKCELKSSESLLHRSRNLNDNFSG